MELPVGDDDAADPDDLVYEVPYESLKEDEDIYAVVTLGAGGKPRYLLGKIHGLLYTACSADVRRAAADGGYVPSSRRAKGGGKSAEPKASVPSSGASSSCGLTKRIAGVIQAVQNYGKAVKKNGFRQLRDEESSASLMK